MLLVALVAVALIFDFLNGLHDAANSIATVVSTRVLSPNVAVVWADVVRGSSVDDAYDYWRHHGSSGLLRNALKADIMGAVFGCSHAPATVPLIKRTWGRRRVCGLYCPGTGLQGLRP